MLHIGKGVLLIEAFWGRLTPLAGLPADFLGFLESASSACAGLVAWAGLPPPLAPP
jgi:hypothetical protein